MAYKIQSVVFPKKKYKTSEKAEKWLKKNNYKIKKLKNWDSKTVWRFRQLPPSHFDKKTFRTKTLSNGVELIVGKYMKK